MDSRQINSLETKYDEIVTFKVEYKISETESDVHTIVTAKKK